MDFPITQIAALIGAEIEGNSEIMINDIAKIEEGKPGSISFLGNTKYLQYVYTTEASAIIVSKEFQPKTPIKPTLLRVDDPYKAFATLLEKSAELLKTNHSGIDPKAEIKTGVKIGEKAYVGAFSYISENVTLGNNVQIYPQSFIGAGVVIGDGSIIYPGVKIYDGCKIGKSCIIHAGACIGSDGFGFAPQEDGTYKKVPQLGIVILEDGVEIGANSCIDRATMGETRILAGSKIDNLVQIAHNVEVGEHTVIAAQTGIAGSTVIGKRCMIGGQVGFVGHIQIADETKFEAQSGIQKSIKEVGSAWRGSPAQPFRNQLRSEIVFKNLYSLQKEVTRLKAEIEILQGNK